MTVSVTQSQVRAADDGSDEAGPLSYRCKNSVSCWKEGVGLWAEPLQADVN